MILNLLLCCLCPLASCGSQFKSFYGEWRITRDIRTPGVFAITEEERNALIGTQVRYAPEKAETPQGICVTPVYEERWIKADDFAKTNPASLPQIGIRSDSVCVVYVKSRGGELCQGPGNILFLKDADTLLTIEGGVFFEMKRIPPKVPLSEPPVPKP